IDAVFQEEDHPLVVLARNRVDCFLNGCKAPAAVRGDGDVRRDRFGLGDATGNEEHKKDSRHGFSERIQSIMAAGARESDSTVTPGVALARSILPDWRALQSSVE